LGPDVTVGATGLGLVFWISDCSVENMGRFSLIKGEVAVDGPPAQRSSSWHASIAAV
jgi:hypothetical protein